MHAPASHRRLCLIALVIMACAAVPALSQNAQQAPMTAPGTAPFFPGVMNKPDASPDAATQKQAAERLATRQKLIVDDTNHLLALAKQLKDAVDNTNKDQLSLDVVKKAAEIEKLAHVIRNEMRDETAKPAN